MNLIFHLFREILPNCGKMLPPNSVSGECPKCGSKYGDATSPSTDIVSRQTDGGNSQKTDLERLPTTESGSIKKAHAMEWLENRDRPSGADLRRTMIEKPADFSGSTYPTDISTVRLTGSPEFIETIAGLFRWIVDMEDYSRRVEINLKETEDRETGAQTGNYALYLSVAERGS